MSDELEDLFRKHLLLISERDQASDRFMSLQTEHGDNHRETQTAQRELLEIQAAYNDQSVEPVAQLREFLKREINRRRSIRDFITQALGTAATTVAAASDELIGACYKETISRKKTGLLVYAKANRPLVGAIRTNVNHFVTDLQKKHDRAGATHYERLNAVVKNCGSLYVPKLNLVAFDATVDQFAEATVSDPAEWALDNDTTLTRPEYVGNIIDADALNQLVKQLTSTSEFVQFAASVGGALVLNSGQELIQMICPELRHGIRFGDLISVTKTPFRNCYNGRELSFETKDDETDANAPADTVRPELEVDFADALERVETELKRRAEESGPSGRWTRIYSVWPAIRDTIQSGMNHGDLADVAKELNISSRTLSDYWNEIKGVAADCFGEKT